MQSSDGPASTLDALTVSVNGLTLTNVTATGVTTTHTYDPLGRRVASSQLVPNPVNPDNPVQRTASMVSYDPYGRVAWTADAAGTTNRFAYDPFTGRRTAVTNALGQATHTAYDAEGRVVATWGATYPVAYEYDAFGRMSAMATTRDPAHESVNLLTLLPAGLTLADVSDPAYPSDLDTTRWLYHEPTGLLTNKVYADSKGTTYSYTPDGKLATRTWARGITTAYGYTPSGELHTITYNDDTPGVTNQYDRLGRQVGVVDGAGEHAYVYDPVTLGLADEHFPDGSVLSRTHDALGRPAGIALGSGYAVTYGYDAYGRFGHVAATVGVTVVTNTYSYLPGSHLISGWTDAATGVSVSRSYEAHRDLLVAVTNSVGATMISAYDYANDALGRRMQRLDAGINAATNYFAYNQRSELTNAVMPVLAGEVQQANAFSWTLDPIGNRTATTHNEETRTFVANELNQYTNILCASAPPRETPLSYDSDGNLTNDAVFAYVYNGENRLVLAEPLAPAVGAKRVRNAYDHQGRRFEKVVDQWTGTAWSNVATNRFLYDGWSVVVEHTHTPTPPYAHTNYYVRGLDLSGSLQGAGGIGGLLAIHRAGIDPDTLQPFNPATHYPFHDGNGNLVQTVDSNGTVTASYVYDAYGNTLAQSGPFADANPYRFSSQYFDPETSLYMYIFRAYSPKLERWMNRDPIGEVGGTHLAAFLQNRAPADVDPLGMTDVSAAELITCGGFFIDVMGSSDGWDDDVRDKVRYMRRYCGLKGRFPLDCSCEGMCANSRVGGFYDPYKRKIVLCDHQWRPYDEMNRTFRHELSHMFDHMCSRARFGCVRPSKGFSQLVCSEIRAYEFAGSGGDLARAAARSAATMCCAAETSDASACREGNRRYDTIYAYAYRLARALVASCSGLGAIGLLPPQMPLAPPVPTPQS